MADAASQSRATVWRRLRWAVVVLGVALPYLAQLGEPSLQRYLDSGWAGNLFILAMGAVLWLPLLGLTWVFRYPVAMVPALVLGPGFALWAHASVDVAADAQGGLGLIVVPVWSLVPAAVGTLMGWGLELRARRRAHALSAVKKES